MNTLRGLSAAFTASLAVHALIGYSVILPKEELPLSENQLLQIDDVRYEKPSAPAVEAAPAAQQPKQPVPRKKIKGIPVPRLQERTEPAPPSDFQKLVDEKIKKQLQQLKTLDTPAPPPAMPQVLSSMTSAELLSDPQKGKIFLGYFSKVKKKIQDTVYQKAGRHFYGRGTVCLGFVLNERGYLEKLAVLEKGTTSDESMKELARQCLRESAPFGFFPKDLGPSRIAFNITIFFDNTN